MTNVMNLITHEGFVMTEEKWWPEKAAEVLSISDPSWNRKTRTPKALQYLDDMKSGDWGFCDVPIIITPEYNIIQGKHRLTALAMAPSGTVVWFFVITGVPAEYVIDLDNTLKRSVSDQLVIQHDVTDPNNKASMARAILRWDSEDGSLTRDVTNNRIIRFVLENNDALARAIGETRNVATRTALTFSVVAPIWWIMHSIDTASCTRFWRSLGAEESEGIRDPERDQPLIMIRDKYRVYPKGNPPSVWWMRGTLIKGWNAWREHRHLKVIRMLPDEAFPKLVY